MNTLSVPRNALWAGIALIALTGLIHVVEAPEYFESATYLGLSFVANALGAALAAYGIWQQRAWGWGLGALVAGGAFVAYVWSRTVGLPGLTGTEFFEPIGIASLLAEGGFVGLCVRVLARWREGDSPTAERDPERLPTR